MKIFLFAKMAEKGGEVHPFGLGKPFLMVKSDFGSNNPFRTGGVFHTHLVAFRA